MMGTDMLSLSCVGTNPWQDCPDPTPGPDDPPTWVNPDSKVFDRVGSCTFEPVTVYAGAECSVVGISFDEMRSRALAQLELGEQRTLEEWFMTRFLCPRSDGNDLTPGTGAVSPVIGVALLEEWLAGTYGGQGVLHVPTTAGALLSVHRLITDFVEGGTCPVTLAGNRVVLGAGYTPSVGPDGAGGCAAAPAGEMWFYITPAMRIRRDGPTLVTGEESQSINTLINDRRLLAESTFVPEVACCTAAAVRVTITAP